MLLESEKSRSTSAGELCRYSEQRAGFNVSKIGTLPYSTTTCNGRVSTYLGVEMTCLLILGLVKHSFLPSFLHHGTSRASDQIFLFFMNIQKVPTYIIRGAFSGWRMTSFVMVTF